MVIFLWYGFEIEGNKETAGFPPLVWVRNRKERKTELCETEKPHKKKVHFRTFMALFNCRRVFVFHERSKPLCLCANVFTEGAKVNQSAL